MKNENLKVAVVGVGKMGLLHASILKTFPNVELSALCEKGKLIRKVCKGLFRNVCVVDDLDKLSDSDLDVVYVTTPIPSHFSIIEKIYSKRIAKNVFTEKTLTSSFDESRKLCDLAQNFESINMVGFMKRFAVTFTKARDMLNQDVIGDLESFEAHAYSSDFFGREKSSKSASRGGVLKDLGAHVIDLALWFFDSFEVNSAKLEPRVGVSSEDSAQFAVTTPDGLEGCFSISWIKENYRMPEFELMIQGSNGSISVNDDKLELNLNNGKSSTLYRHDLGDHVGFQLGGPEYFRENEYYINSVLEHREAVPNFYTSSKVDYIIEQVKSRAGNHE